MFFILDVIAVIIFLMTVISCRSKGFFKSFFGLIKVVLALIVAYLFMPTAAYFYRTSFVEKLVSDTVAERINNLAQKTAEGFNLEKLFGDMPSEFADILSRYGADGDKLAERFGGLTAAAEDSINDLATSITSAVVHAISDILAFATLFVGALIVLSIVIWIVGLIMKLPVLSTIDKGLGFLFGIISGLLLIWVYANLVTFAVEAISIVKPGLIGTNVIENTFIIKYISDNFMFGFAAPNP
ncbi:MAG: CvpA family protein [Clostridia bacterium]|nr:CvpA family protein [Clostridia bacterium]